MVNLLNAAMYLISGIVLGINNNTDKLSHTSCKIKDAKECANIWNSEENFKEEYPTYANLTTPDLIERQGYPVQSYKVVTEDGYILTLFRVSHSNRSPPRAGKIPVLLMHGFTTSSVLWVWMKPEKNLLYMLVDAGFDVWLGNARGTRYSLEHVSLPSNSKRDLRYWDFSFHEMGYYDLPAVFNLIEETTSQPSFYYVGYSMGNTQFFSGLMSRPELSVKIRGIFSLATSGFQPSITNILFRTLVPVLAPMKGMQMVSRLTGGYLNPTGYIIPDGTFTKQCSIPVINCGFCYSVYSALMGVDPCRVDFAELPGILSHLPDTSSVRSASHVAQNMLSGKFRQYDYGIWGNVRRYGNINPPSYDWSRYNVPTFIYYGDNDNLSVPKDVLRTANVMGKNLKKIVRIPDPSWGHMDYAVGNDADIYIYKDITDILMNETVNEINLN
ncbi:lipase member K-like [Folsomia candida]|uniref:lipase member K-like n=1 Tax=Folsomia candida TaxID=158441 RepID=UPI001604D3D4|nr:lipase member K-like [Folsomia candida]